MTSQRCIANALNSDGWQEVESAVPIELPCEKVKMPMFCVVYGCSNRSTREKEKSLTYNQPTRGSVKYPNHPIQDYLPSQRVEAAITHETN